MNKNCKDWKNRERISVICEPTRIRAEPSLTSNVLVGCIRTKPNRVCLDLSSCITSITITCNSPKTKQQITKSCKLTFILRPCDRHPGEGFFYLCGNVTNSVWIQYYTVTPPPWYELMEIREIKIESMECSRSLYWIWLSKRSQLKCTHLEFLRNRTLWLFPRKESMNRAFCQNALRYAGMHLKKGEQIFDSSVFSKTFRQYTLEK